MAENLKPVEYVEYLGLNKILNAQNMKSVEAGRPAHDEMLFIIVHQVYELWFKEILHEVDSVCRLFKNEKIDESNIGIAVSRLKRVIEIQRILLDQFRVLETMTPLDFMDFRELLSPASGFQSSQFRIIENRLGLLRGRRTLLNGFPYESRIHQSEVNPVLASEKDLSLFDLVDRWLERTPFLHMDGFDFASQYKSTLVEMLKRDEKQVNRNAFLSEKEKKRELGRIQQIQEQLEYFFDTEKYEKLRQEGRKRLSFKAHQAALFVCLYRDMPILNQPYRLIETLIDIDENWTKWRYQHALLAHRMIGTKIGTGGTSGYDYLRSAAEKHKIYEDFFDLSTYLIPRSELPKLPQDLVKKLSFHFSV